MESERGKYISVLVWLAVLLASGCAAPPKPPSDAEMMLHEWDISETDRPRLVTDESGREEYEDTEKPENLVTWVYDGTSFTPVAKVTDGERYTIVHDYLGTPTQAYDGRGNLVWEMLLDVYGEVKECHGDRTLVPFRYQGQYEDIETGLYYNRFRYYSSDTGTYLSQDPIRLLGNNPNFYAYTFDSNSEVDILGLDCGKVKFNPQKKFSYNRGGVMSVMEHILQRHRLNTKYDDVSKFITDSPRQIKKIINEAISNGNIDKSTNSITATFSRNIGTNADGSLTKTIKILFDEKGWVRTAFPI